jgi:hypothetical protein
MHEICPEEPERDQPVEMSDDAQQAFPLHTLLSVCELL